MASVSSSEELKSNKTCNCVYDYSVPYLKRRADWGMMFQVGMSMYEPDLYVPDFSPGSAFKEYYGTAGLPMIEVAGGIKKNINAGSILLEAGLGQYTNNRGRNETVLQVMTTRLGLLYSLDTLFLEPFVVPYVGGGASMAFYSESAASQLVSGNTNIGFYYLVGVLLQMDWVDPEADQEATEFGLENSFLYLELRGFEMTGGRVADLGSPMQTGLGLKLEF